MAHCADCKHCNSSSFVTICLVKKIRVAKSDMACDKIEANVEVKKSRHNKYNAVKTQVDGIWFDSKMEAEYFGLLRLRKLAGEIEFKIHPKYQLTKTISWKLDFEVLDLRTGVITYVDVKGQRLASFNRNLRLWEEVRDEPITLITKKGKTWVEKEV